MYSAIARPTDTNSPVGTNSSTEGRPWLGPCLLLLPKSPDTHITTVVNLATDTASLQMIPAAVLIPQASLTQIDVIRVPLI